MFYRFLVLCILCSCNGAGKSKAQPNNESKASVRTIVGFDEDSGGDCKVLNYLSYGQETDAIRLFLQNYKPLRDRFNDFDYYVVQDDNPCGKYIAYRLAEYIGDLDNNMLIRLLLMTEADSGRLKDVVPLEYMFLQFERSNFTEIALVDSLKAFMIRHRYSRRLKYLWAVAALKSENVSSAIDTLRNLFVAGYYRKPIYRAVCSSNAEEQKKFFTQAIRKSILLDSSCFVPRNLFFDPSLFDHIKATDCKPGLSSKDSVSTVLYYAYSAVIHKDFTKFDAIYDLYQKRNKGYNPDEFKLFEKGHFYDMALKRLFLSSKYKEMVLFVRHSVTLNPVINIESNGDFYELIRSYYRELINRDAREKEIKEFFNAHFSKYFSSS